VIDRQFGTIDVFLYVNMAEMDPRYRARFGLSAS
jgi:hypothetical protein